MFKLFRSKISIAILLIIFVGLSGVFGYRYLFGFNWLDACYMTVITVTTVGFSEVGPMDENAKIFTVFLIIASVFIFAFAISVITEYILGRNSLELLKKKKVKNKINNLTEHIIVCGFGRNGNQAVERLKAYKRPFVVIEKDREVLEKYEDEVL
ncbi:MAG: potassium channel family protein, partial [Bacteroidota bacterium]